mmetsp:Transcript_12840/g.39511  ORF Transcript_12840/g.39511 Transcript_12840/m.39511 type:complete len:261 (-) Transcript_12840:59-841(-)|eukprot:CAMPEP_0198722246 /NCGR_PEP_ID=MMETSP1475-20131203/42_1 /TAXON_ID= ORGANISM="Unidentified sp., Strain CCMP1999" /NCGR_SAMPLE_ID=MMETSP1475 /ASSEMBLY_ACC=CAM_ASM_001111 /LENGTH=260 /DNA_ID=CAMNT_0044483145 /DNA_START=348 /DNA_END=1130 /DNA_ORIENTATION=+
MTTSNGFRYMAYMMGHMIRETGQALERLGARAKGQFYCAEPLNRHRQIMNVFFERPLISPGVFLAPCAALAGSVHVGAGSSIWYGATLRGDDAAVVIGEATNIQDRVVIASKDLDRYFSTTPINTVIGDRVTIGHGAIINNATIEDECLVGMNAIIGVNAVLRKHSMIAAGSVVAAQTEVPSGELWAGTPATFKRKLSKEEIESIQKRAIEYNELAADHLQNVHKTPDHITAENMYQQLMSFPNNITQTVSAERPSIQNS